MSVKVLFFAHLRELAGADSVDLQMDDVEHRDQVAVRDLLEQMAKQLPKKLINALADETAMVSVNQKYAGWDGVVRDGDEVGLLPPVSGG